jgi:hypothetical protein
LQLRMGDQPIDVLIAGPQVQPGDIYDLAQRQGVVL